MKTLNTNYEFKTFYNLSTNEWEYKRDENNNLIIDRINDTDEIAIIKNNEFKEGGDLTIGDKLVSINGNKISKLSDNEIEKLLLNFEKFELTDQELKELKFEFKNSEEKTFIKEGSYIEYEGLANASVYVKIKNISNIDVKNNTFNGDLTVSVSWKIEKLHPLSKEHMIVDATKDEYWYCMFTPDEFEKMQIGEVFFLKILIQFNKMKI